MRQSGLGSGLGKGRHLRLGDGIGIDLSAEAQGGGWVGESRGLPGRCGRGVWEISRRRVGLSQTQRAHRQETSGPETWAGARPVCGHQ